MRLNVPTLLLDKKKSLENIRRMVEKARRNGVRLRPHFKTHQSAQVGAWFRDFGVDAITVSSFRMANYFANQGWQDIMVAFPANVLEIDRINELASRVKLHVVAVNIDTVEALAHHLRHPVQLWLKIDTGYRRTGLLPHNHSELDKILNEVKQSEKLRFEGFVVHDGHTYKQTDTEAIQTIHNTSVYLLHMLRKRYMKQFPGLQLSIGDTPSCSILENLSGVDEIRPGNFVFYDLTQQRIGSCSFDDIAVCMACPVVAKHPERGEIILYGGSVHFSKDSLLQEDGSVSYGRIVEFTENGWTAPLEGIELVSLSQEHSIVKASPQQFDKYKIGDMMGILPVHSCLTADLMKGYVTVEGEYLDHLSGLPQQCELVS
ncbi:D-serine deaminase-like pyridoxal phosphate-dependent protein [Pontibacter ummariensis]|uniref:D-serine deaminase, pyridoxal phosphate-dependent n=1 Tax=Pontibacter ummariensis TaxID=1610492 RepID=A0A239GJ00_9BACT|nr:alanine racemase [Pontibacter ummariensis]PRY11279.1 D-serine deaminase-like pyridoxal phosphate-dependent protein [Pontibacter ummariensis]SNS68758.1 D-serine deaminase, pyridoxal phosphate-dependent [Pontibacter ummariensis]